MLRKLYWFLSTQFGIDPRKTLRSFLGLPRYVSDFFRFRSNYSGRLELLPCLHDWYEEAGTTKSEYFWQDLLVARKIFEAKPEKHVDVGSRVDGFVAHVASFRKIEVFDIRAITTQIPGVIFTQVDLMKPTIGGMVGYCDSLSCLHALEHFGLGRYSDPIDPQGYEHGLANMANLLRRNGSLYLSVPIGIDRVEFNANRVFDPRVIVALAAKHYLILTAFIVIRKDGKIEAYSDDDKISDNFVNIHAVISELAQQRYALGIFVFIKRINS